MVFVQNVDYLKKCQKDKIHLLKNGKEMQMECPENYEEKAILFKNYF